MGPNLASHCHCSCVIMLCRAMQVWGSCTQKALLALGHLLRLKLATPSHIIGWAFSRTKEADEIPSARALSQAWGALDITMQHLSVAREVSLHEHPLGTRTNWTASAKYHPLVSARIMVIGLNALGTETRYRQHLRPLHLPHPQVLQNLTVSCRSEAQLAFELEAIHITLMIFLSSSCMPIHRRTFKTMPAQRKHLNFRSSLHHVKC